MKQKQMLGFLTPVILAFMLIATGVFKAAATRAGEPETASTWKCIDLLDPETKNKLSDFDKFFDDLYKLPENYTKSTEEEKVGISNGWINDLLSEDKEKSLAAAAYLGITKKIIAREAIEKYLTKLGKNNRAVWICVRSLGQICDPNSVGILISLLDHQNLNVRVYSRVGLVEITGVYFGDDKEKWRKWQQDNQQSLERKMSEANEVTSPQISTEVVSEEQRSLWAYYRMGTVARHKGIAEEATKAYESVIKKSVGQEAENMHKVISNIYLAEIASEIQKDKQLALKRLQDAIATVNGVDMTKMRQEEVVNYTILKNWASNQLAKLKEEKHSVSKESIDEAELNGLFMVVITITQMSLEGTGFTLEQLAQNNRSRIDADIAQLALIYNCMNGNTNIPKAEKYLSSLAQRDSYFALYAATMLDKMQEETQKESQKPVKQEEIKRSRAAIPEIPADQIAQFIEEMKSDDGKVRDAAIRKLTVKAGPEGVKALEQAQKSPDKYTRYWAAIALSHTEQTAIKPDIHLLIEAMGDSNKSLWWEAACALNGVNPPTLGKEEIGTLIAMAKCPKDRTVDRSGDMAEILGNCLSTKAEMAVPELIKLLHDENQYTKLNACIILRKIGPSAIAAFPELRKYFDYEDADVRRFAIEAMKSINPKEIEVLIKKQEQEKAVSSEKRTTELRPQIPEAVEKLGDPDIAVRRQGMKVFTLLGQEPEWKIDSTTETGKQVISALMKAANDPDYSIRIDAKETLCKLNTPEAIPVYIDILNEKDDLSNADLKAQAAKTLGIIGPAAKDAVPALNKIASVDKGYVGRAAGDALRSIGGEALYVPELIEKLKNSRKEKRRDAIIQLRVNRSSEVKQAAPMLIEILKNESENEVSRIEAAKTLASWKTAEAVPIFVDIFSKGNPSTDMLRHESIRAIGSMGDVAKPVIPVLIEMLKNKNGNPIDRAEAACALGNLKVEEVIPILITILKQKGEQLEMGLDSYIRSNAARALGLMGAIAKNAVPILTESLNDDSPEVRECAAKALEKIRN